MLDAEQIRGVIYQRVVACSESCNSHHINHVMGQIRGLMAVLNGGDPVIAGHESDSGKVFEAAGIPFTRDGDDIVVGDEWLLSHGFADGEPKEEYLKWGLG